jgi:hypothetical protein
MINFNPQSSPPQAASAAVDNPQSSIINPQSSIINHQSSIINHAVCAGCYDRQGIMNHKS